MRKPFHLPECNELVQLGREERLNVFRQFFASSRYGRLIIQQLLVRSATDRKLVQEIPELEKAHNQNFEDMLRLVTNCGFIEEFVVAVKEEDIALQKIIEAYDKRMEGRF